MNSAALQWRGRDWGGAVPLTSGPAGTSGPPGRARFKSGGRGRGSGGGSEGLRERERRRLWGAAAEGGEPWAPAGQELLQRSQGTGSVPLYLCRTLHKYVTSSSVCAKGSGFYRFFKWAEHNSLKQQKFPILSQVQTQRKLQLFINFILGFVFSSIYWTAKWPQRRK